jgi:hypothetical protein
MKHIEFLKMSKSLDPTAHSAQSTDRRQKNQLASPAYDLSLLLTDVCRHDLEISKLPETMHFCTICSLKSFLGSGEE